MQPNTFEEALRASTDSLGVTGEQTHNAIAEVLAGCGQCFFVDLGCGVGGLTAAVIRARIGACGMTFGTGIDAERTHIAEYNGRFSKAQGVCLRLGGTERLGFQDDSFDAVIASFFLEHLTVEEQRRVLVEARRLAPLLVIGVHRFEGFDSGSMPMTEEEPGRVAYRTPVGPMRLGLPGYYERILVEAGFRTAKKHAAVRYPDDPRLGKAAGLEAASVFIAER